MLSADASPLASPQAVQNGCGYFLLLILPLFKNAKGNPLLPWYAVVVPCSFQPSIGLSTWMSQLVDNPTFLSEASSKHKFISHADKPEKSAPLADFATFLLASKGLR